MPIDITSWGISTTNSPSLNSKNFNDNIASDQKIYLPGSSDPYPFDLISIRDVDNVEFYGVPDSNGNLPVIKFSDNDHIHLEIADADSFNIYDLAFDGRDAIHEGGIWAKDGATNGTIKNVKVYDPSTQGITIGESDYESTPKTYNITVEDCEVYGQRKWGGTTGAKAMILAGGGADDVTFENCTAYRAGFYDSTPDSPADLFDTDNATNVKYINCTAEGTDNENIRKGVGFWNEGEQEASSEYWNCTAKKTDGGLGATEKSIAIAHNFYFDDCSHTGWAARCQGHRANLEIYDSMFDHCSSSGPWRKGGVVAETNITVDNCDFINTPEFNDEGGTNFNISFYTSDEANDPYTMNIKNNTFDRGVTSFNDSSNDAEVTVYVQNNLFQHEAALNQYGPNYTWNVSGNDFVESATTFAQNSPTSSTSIGVEYQNHVTDVQYTNGESLDGMLLKARNAVNTDSGAYVTTEINMSDDTITFIQKDANSSDNNVNIINIDIADWQNGLPFVPTNPSMS